ncbi:MAG: hypothetical protein ACRCTD_16655 [Beijerinckiaceae bacterium]
MSDANARPAKKGSLLTSVSVLILVGVEVFGTALAAAWAIAGLFQLGKMVEYGLMGLFCLFGAYAMLAFARRVFEVEPIG